MTAFDEAFELVLKFEGGYVNDPDDPGGETKFGISKKAYPNVDVASLTKEEAKEIYYRDYWLPAKCEEIARYSRPLAIIHFDTAVNTGVTNAGKILQKAINRQGFSIKVDGIVGEVTLFHLRVSHKKILLREYTLERIRYYNKIAENPRLRRFLRGWINRALGVFDAVMPK